ncbi:stage II sporulation protein M [Zafaria sp. Z1313]|uniref:stage II sporulation protein M n=1 Tax=unclassified Zafaria TaxID=2828765 RepID=UPI002E79EC7D|nr:stage II sporulation protein M [Zafaria sp. J156]MEE1619954.1 stage II sporulation protein M [Zafaria sp. J156]
MDLDAFVAVHQPDWQRLDALSSRRRLSGPEADEFLALYERVSTHLSMVRSVEPDTVVSADLSARLSRARTRFTGARGDVLAELARFFVVSLPAAFYRIRHLTVVIGVLFTALATAFGFWAAGTPGVVEAMGSHEELRAYAEHRFVDYYSENPAASFAGAVWSNNAFIAGMCVAFGITGLYVPFVLVQNAIGIGMAGGVMAAFGELDTFFLYILPHGFMELTAIFIAAAAGLRIFWAWVAPGPRTRAAALAAEGRSLMTVALGLVLVLLVSGIVEAYVTPSPLPHGVRMGLGLAVLAGYWTYTLVLGRRAVASGATGDMDTYDAGATVPTA